MAALTRPGFRIAQIRGIPVYLHPTWLVIFVLITWSLANQYLLRHPAWSPGQHWSAGVITSLLFFASVVFHELAHSIVAQHYKLPVVSITLFVFGGVSAIERDPASPVQEFNIAIAGPLSSLVLAAAFWALTLVLPVGTVPGAICFWLAETNAILALFNLVPGFPLDGGRVFRAIVWGVTHNLPRATRAAGTAGKFIAWLFIVFGGWRALFHGDFVSGLWIALIGWFLLSAAQESTLMVTLRESLRGLRAADVMSREIPTFPGGHSLADYSAEVLRTGRRCHLVVTSDGRLSGLINIHALNSVPQEEWISHSVQSVMVPREKLLCAHPDDPLPMLLERLLKADINQMPVVAEAGENGSFQIMGLITRDSILRVLRTRSEVPSATASS
ncbi:MAG TPA: site-2 protease family protein [Candidatus Acidoferrum sp.]|jgi:Zn-dependent protease